MLSNLKNLVGSVPFIGPISRRVYARLIGHQVIVFKRSDQYWEDRYRSGGTSGSGSYGRLALFKAEFINKFVIDKGILSIVEFGCGDGAQLQLAKYPSYVGFDVSRTSVELCRKKFSGQKNYNFYLVGSRDFNDFQKAEIAISLDVIYHLVEDDVFKAYMQKLFSSAEKYIVIYAYDFERTYASRHEKGRNFTKWIDEYAQHWRLVKRHPNKYPFDPRDPGNTSQSDFFVYEKCN